MRTPLIALTLSLAFAQGETPVERRELVRDAVDNYFRSAKLMREFAVVRHTERREFDGGGKLKSSERWTQHIDFIGGVRVGWTIERDGKPLSPGELAMSQDAARQEAAEWKAMTPRQRAKILAKAEKEADYLKEFPHALVFSALPDEALDGRPAMVWAFKPKPGYKARSMGGRAYEGVVGKLWLDKEERQLMRLEAEVVRDVTVGGFLAKIEKGTKFELSQARVEPGCWLPVKQSIRYGARILMVKGIHRAIDTRYREWRRSPEPPWSGN
ncbi:MAG: hypothetical protein C0504_02380 [Candidatus Solibacter sp.]|nr:hypothetical protein [Candidatus Solibacter sp.]